MNNTEIVLQNLIKKGLDHSASINEDAFLAVDWNSVVELSIQKEVCAVAFDGLEHIPENLRPGLDTLMDWLGQVSYIEEANKRIWQVASTLGKLWAEKNISPVILKGKSIAQYYPIPDHRYSCDLDVFIGEGWDTACKMLEDKGVNLVYEVYKEAEFTIDDVYVECHRYITPLRGYENLYACEKYLRSLLEAEKTLRYETTPRIPPLMFTVTLYMEHALFDLLHGKLSLKHVTDWIVLRKQLENLEILNGLCKEFGFDKFMMLINNLADVLDGSNNINELKSTDRKVYESLFVVKKIIEPTRKKSWFERRVYTMKTIVNNREMYNNYGYCSMSTYLWNALYTHFFKKEVKL